MLAPDYPGFGNSDQPLTEDFDYTFDNFAKIMEGFIETLGVKKYSLYLMDYGAQISQISQIWGHHTIFSWVALLCQGL
ncbi:MAG: alpha/beta fold hydrolase [Thermodesulfobacteriota bacterium]